jgi:dihydrofolate reductase
VFIATSLDGFIAGEEDDLSWLGSAAGGAPADPDAVTYEEFIKDVGALLMGRRTYDVVMGFDVEWPYGGLPVLVASHRDLGDEVPAGVRRVEGSIQELVAQARTAAAGRDVYLDGGALIRQACGANLVDELTITVAPIALGSGQPLFAGMPASYPVEIVHVCRYEGGMIQVRLVPAPDREEGDAT